MKHLKIIFTVSILVFFLNTLANAQETNQAKIGIKGGVNFSNLYTKDADNTKTLTGFNAGIFAKIPITSRFAIQPELYFTTKGADVTYRNAFVDGTARFKLDYVELPILIVANITKNFHIEAGAYAGVLVSGKVKNQSNVGLFNFEDNIKVEDYNRLDAGLAAGVGFDFGALGIGARYTYGLTKVGKEHTFLGTPYRFPDAVNGVLNVYLSVGF
ncbi:MAG: porin family protein [Bacteroidota bacterium]